LKKSAATFAVISCSGISLTTRPGRSCDPIPEANWSLFSKNRCTETAAALRFAACGWTDPKRRLDISLEKKRGEKNEKDYFLQKMLEM